MNALEKYRPQWLYIKPAGVEEEPFQVPFSFDLVADGRTYLNLPIQLDNEELIIRGIFFQPFPAFFIFESLQPPPYVLGRLIDTYGNPTSDELSLNFGGWANPGASGCGFPLDPEIPCAAGGVVLMDVAATNTGIGAGGATSPKTYTLSGALLCVRRRRCS